MSDDVSVFDECSDYKLHCTGTDLIDEDCFCTENLHAEKEFLATAKTMIYYQQMLQNCLIGKKPMLVLVWDSIKPRRKYMTNCKKSLVTLLTR